MASDNSIKRPGSLCEVFRDLLGFRALVLHLNDMSLEIRLA